MFKIVYIGKKIKLETEDLSEYISILSGYNINFIKELSIETAFAGFFEGDPTVLMIIEEKTEGLIEFINEVKKDETFKYLPIIIVLNNTEINNTLEIRKKYYTYGINNFLTSNFEVNELVLACNSAIKNKIRLDQVVKQLGEVSEKNITKSIQLDLIKKFIPLTVWEKSETLAEGQSLDIPEEEQDLAIIFADLESFTTIAENLSPKEVIQMLNGVFDITTQIVYQNYGDIDKFIGDAFLAVFKSPEMALLSAILIQDEIDNYNNNRIKNNLPVTKFRMGLHYGKVIRGSVGGTLRYDNTLIGDPINTAQRLESMSPVGGILASKKVLSQIESQYLTDIKFKSYQLKGKNTIIEAYEFININQNHENLKSELFKKRKTALR